MDHNAMVEEILRRVAEKLSAAEGQTSGEGAPCACCGKPAQHMVYWGVSY